MNLYSTQLELYLFETVNAAKFVPMVFNMALILKVEQSQQSSFEYIFPSDTDFNTFVN